MTPNFAVFVQLTYFTWFHFFLHIKMNSNFHVNTLNAQIFINMVLKVKVTLDWEWWTTQILDHGLWVEKKNYYNNNDNNNNNYNNNNNNNFTLITFKKPSWTGLHVYTANNNIDKKQSDSTNSMWLFSAQDIKIMIINICISLQ